ncbi:MAG TPA: AEC family transporter [Rhodocyclaceae bacterium]|jgi:predicted permease|nr:AEC family transporter [Rhodocyclaceae bacterium]
MIATFLHHLALAAPLFVLILAGYLLARFCHWSKEGIDALSRFVFTMALPALLFHLMSDLSRLPPVDSRLLAAFFGGCFITFVIGRLAGWKLFGLDGVSQSVFALGGIFSNNVLLGIPLARATLGEAAIPCVALVLVFNALTLWTLVTISVEWSRHGSLSARGFVKTAKNVLTNPIVASILSGATVGLTGIKLPAMITGPLTMTADAATPLSLIVLGMGLARYDWHNHLRLSSAICVLKLVVQPLVVWSLATLIGLPTLETQVVVLLASIAIGVNVYLMAHQFKTLEGPVAASMVISTVMAAITTPLALTLVSL